MIPNSILHLVIYEKKCVKLYNTLTLPMPCMVNNINTRINKSIDKPQKE